MTDPLRDDEIPALRALDEAATPGPWETSRSYRFDVMAEHPSGCLVRVACTYDGDGDEQDAALIAAFRTALPRALARIEADRERIAALEAALRDIASKARFEQSAPTGLHMTCLSIIEKTARALLAERKELK